MARFEIKSKDGNSIRYSGKPRYNGSYLKPAFVEFSEISSPTPIAWEVGDYLDYSRTGMRYYLYSIPQPSKKARSGANGGSFTYSNVQLFSATKDLEIALFRDLVSNDNNIHFSTSPDVATFENVEGIARRIQACLDDLYPGKWEIRLAEFSADEDAELIESISTAKDFALSGGTCLDALSKIYELWDNLGWIHSYENGKEVITIGYANKRIDANTTDSYLYGKGNGLTVIKKNQTNKDEFATRLYVYGSERNLPTRYYNDKEILNAESVDIRNLMLPLDSWGKTDGLPDARKAYLENAEAVAKFGVIPKTHYFDSEDAGADIYPTIERLTIGEIRSVMQSTDEYYPTDRYADGDRADAVLDAINPTDDGVLKRDGKEYDAVSYIGLQSVDKKVHVTGGLNNAPIIINHPLFSKVVDTDFSKGKVVADLSQTITIPDRGYTSVSARVDIEDSEEVGYGASHGYADFVATKSDDGQNWVIKLGRVSVDYSKTIYDTHKFPVYGFVTIDANTVGAESGEITIKFGPGSGSVSIKRVLDKTFIVYLKQIGFNINTQASLGKGKTISMKTGTCAGRNFVISDCLYSPTLDAWLITCKRQQDDTLGMLFPNSSYEIAEGDTFVLLDIAMPELYVSVAQNRLLAEGWKLLSRASKIQSNYEPSIDAKVMVESGRNLREGMFMEISDEDIVDGTTDYILIDSLSIYEDESAIPTYKVTLREKKKVSYKGTPSATSANDTKSVEDETEEQQVNVDLTGYAKETYVDEKVSEVKNALDAIWSLDENGNLVTEKQVIVKNNLIVAGDTSSEGTGSNPEVAGTLIGIKVNGTTYDNPINGILTIPDYPTSLEWSAINGKPTKLTEFTNDAGFITSAALNGYATQSWVERKGYLTSVNSEYYPALYDYGSYISFDFASSFKSKGQGSGYIEFYDSGWYNFRIGSLAVNGSAYVNGNEIYHTGNFNPADYLPLSGGTMKDAATIKWGNNKCSWDGAPEGFIGMSTLREDAAYGYYAGLSFKGYYGFQIRNYAGEDIYEVRGHNASTWGTWRTLIHSGNIGSYNAGSATKLQTARSIWGNSFDGTGNVDGTLTIRGGENTGINIHNTYGTFNAIRFYGVSGENFAVIHAFDSYASQKNLLNINATGGISLGSYDRPAMFINSSGNVLIGTTDDNGFTLDVNGPMAVGTEGDSSIHFRRTGYNRFICTKSNGGAFAWRVNGSSTDAMILAANGNLNLTYGLSVAGAVTMSSTLSVGGDVFFKTAGKLDAYGNFHFTSPTTGSWAIVRGNGNDALLIDNATGNTTIYGNLVVSGDTSTGSDIRFKDKLSDHRIALSDIANAPLFTFTWNNREDKDIHLGSSAQYWEKVAPWLVRGEDFKTLDYSTLGVAIGISLANKAVNHEERIKILEKENKALKEQIRRIQYGS